MNELEDIAHLLNRFKDAKPGDETTNSLKRLTIAIDALLTYHTTKKIGNSAWDYPVYTHKQMTEMIQRTRSWTLNDPSGPLPFLPVQWHEGVDYEDNIAAMVQTLPPYKKPHWLLKLLFKHVY